MAYYKDLRDYIKALEARGLLWRIKSPFKKETELMPLVRWQYRGLSEPERKGFLFENVTDVKGKKYDIPLFIGGLASSTEIYALGLNCQPKDIGEKWTQAQLHPIPPKLVKDGPVHEVVHKGKELKELGLEQFPFPTSSPGFSGLVRATDAHFFSKDPETGVRNVGLYSGQVAGRDRMTIGMGPTQHMALHLRKAKEWGQPLPIALVIGTVPAVVHSSLSHLPYGTDELTVAGGLAGEPIEIVKCQTVDIEVPATAEIVFEGQISTEVMEPSTGSFGEYSGYMAETHLCPVFNISCITHRKNPIFTAFAQQMPPSEGSTVNVISHGYSLYKFLKYDCNIPGVIDVAFHESGGARMYCVIQMKKRHPSEAWQALNASVGFTSSMGKFTIAVDEDIDPRDPDAVNWALGFCVQPHRDMRITMGKIGMLDPSTAPPGSSRKEHVYPFPSGASAVLIDATRKWHYPPIALPRKEYMEKARQMWEAEGLPPLKPRTPWFGMELGWWPDEYREAAEAVVRGDVWKLGEKAGKQQKPFHLE